MKKNLFLLAFTAMIMLATSCQRGGEGDSDLKPDKDLKVRIANVGVKKRSIDTPAQASQITLENGIIFVLNSKGDVTYKEAINTTQITGVGQVLAQQVAKTDKVYIVANLTEALTTKLNTAANLTLTKINEELLSIASTVGADYTKATLANSDAQSKAIIVSSTDATATVSVNISPVYSRIELASVEGSAGTDNTLSSFDVMGVYVTDYHMQYTLGGLFGGSIYEQKQSLDFSNVDNAMKNEGVWSSAATGTADVYSVIPEAGKSWVYNSPAGGLPRLIVKLKNIVGEMGGLALDPTNEYYLSLTSYSKSGVAITKMERAKVYRLEKIAFDLNQIAEKPNEDQVTLTVKVTVVDWVIEVIDGEL